MTEVLVDVLASGAVCLGKSVVCDGFVPGFPFRVQTHIHDDHMGQFDRSKGLQDFFLTPETFDLLVAERNADLCWRTNFHRVQRGTTLLLDDDAALLLLSSDHMLGACQVQVQTSCGVRLGYSGDFNWPLEDVIKVDQLVIDSTYGSPESVRHYTQAEAEECLIELVSQRLRFGSVHINAHRGTIERVLHVLAGKVGVPILASARLQREAKVFQRYGFAPECLTLLGSNEGHNAVKSRAYVRLYAKGDDFGKERLEGTSVTISAFMADRRHPLTRYTDRAYKVAMSNHADFNGVLEYVKATGAATVITDNTRNHGLHLAMALKGRLGVDAQPSSNRIGPRWR